MRARGVIAFGLIGLLALSVQPSAGHITAVAPGDGQSGAPAELDTLNEQARKCYAASRSAELDAIGAVVIVSGDDLILRRGKTRVVATVVPLAYHSLKCVSHVTLGLYTLFQRSTGKPLPALVVASAKEFRAAIAAAAPAVEKCGFDADTLARQNRLLVAALAFLDRVLTEGQVSEADLIHYVRSQRADLISNMTAVARHQLTGVHKQMMAWKRELTPDEWSNLRVIVPGTQLPRQDNAAVQYFTRLLGEPGEGGRVVYAESLWDEEKAVNLLGSRILEGKMGGAFFGDPARMHRDLLADQARTVIDEILAAP